MIFFISRGYTPPYYAGADSDVPVSTLSFLSLIDVLPRQQSVQLSLRSLYTVSRAISLEPQLETHAENRRPILKSIHCLAPIRHINQIL